jgi:hypothetical protein
MNLAYQFLQSMNSMGHQVALASATIQGAVKGKSDAQGLAVIMHNTYREIDCPPLDTTNDGKAMKDAFQSLNFATILLKDFKKYQVEALATALACYNEYPEGYKTFIIYYSGHGDRHNKIVADDGEIFDYEEVIVENLKNGSSQVMKESKLLMLIDADRGMKLPALNRSGKPERPPLKMVVAYAAGDGYGTFMNPDGSVWSQLVATELNEGRKTSMNDVLREVRRKMEKEYKPTEALPTVSNPYDLTIELRGE